VTEPKTAVMRASRASEMVSMLLYSSSPNGLRPKRARSQFAKQRSTMEKVRSPQNGVQHEEQDAAERQPGVLGEKSQAK
jgi:hypothetical protein